MVLAGITLIQLFNMFCFQKWLKPPPKWYHHLPLFLSGFALFAGLANRFSRVRFQQMVLGVLSILLFLNAGTMIRNAHASLSRTSFTVPLRDDIIAFIRSTPSDSLWAFTDCGKFSYWGERDFINLDGLINNYGYQLRLHRGELGAYLLENKVRYLILRAYDGEGRSRDITEKMYKHRMVPNAFTGEYERFPFYVYSYLYDHFSDTLSLPKEAEVFRTAPKDMNSIVSRFLVYDLELARKIWDKESE